MTRDEPGREETRTEGPKPAVGSLDGKNAMFGFFESNGKGTKMGKRIDFVVFGEPMGKQRPKAAAFNGHARVYTPAKTTSYEAKVLYAFEEAKAKCGWGLELGPVAVAIVARFGLCKGDYGKKGLNGRGAAKLSGKEPCMKRADADNIAKICLDAINKLAFQDDSQVVELTVSKRWDEAPSVTVSVMALGTQGE